MNNSRNLIILITVFILLPLNSCSVQYPVNTHHEEQRNLVKKSDVAIVKPPSEKPSLEKPSIETTTIQNPEASTDVKPKTSIIAPSMSVEQLNSNLFMAAKVGNSQLMTKLVQQGADVNARNENGETALHAAATKGHVGVVNFLYGHNAETNARTVEGWTALHSAARFGHAGVVQALIEGGAIVGYLTKDGKTALSFARQLGYEEVVTVLIAKGATR